MGIKACIAKSLLSSLRNAVFYREYFSSSGKVPLIITAHPDDELLIGGIIQRLSRLSDTNFITLTDGNGNTSIDRKMELKNSLNTFGYSKPVRILFREKQDILEDICTKNPAQIVQDAQIERLASNIHSGVNKLEEEIERTNANLILVPDYAGGHLVHDITQMMAVIAARRINRQRPIKVAEFPQSYIQFTNPSQVGIEEIRTLVTKAINNGGLGSVKKNDLDPRLQFSSQLGMLSPKKEARAISYPEIGMTDGLINLTPEELIRKLQAKLAYKSQKTSINRLFSNIEFADLSIEQLRGVPLERDYTQRPLEGPLVYEIVTWRDSAKFKDFSRLYQALLKMER